MTRDRDPIGQPLFVVIYHRPHARQDFGCFADAVLNPSVGD